MDRIDVQLATALSHNGRATFQELGALVRLSANTVADRVRRLQREGVIAGFSAVIDERALGKTLGVLSDIKLREGVERVAFAESLTHIPQVIGALRLTGEYDYQLHIVCQDPAEFEGLVDRLKHDYGVASLNSRLILREVPVDKAKLLQVVG
ncbi:Lrp/AsnC family transcriptional regulator [Nostocoides veronense]|uniref:Lrp/AsnC family transcriptional regulator n=1 Tax=Nostocoides veronense TaxID=330836 RepID=A0ABN2LWU5_9MICO